jgi:prepilin-type N-terminal cleavage/methylation domain-containing protein/prepilin-type processing-associated H-X9-DG protein
MRRGFTLIELLVVIAIIAILAAILFPVFAKAREKARQSSCLSNVKQLALAVMQYIQDYDEMFPYAYRYNQGSPAGTYWDDALVPYIKNTQVTRCPSVASQARCYGWNFDYLGYSWGGNTQGPNTTLGQVASPAETVLLCESNHYGAFYCDRTSLWTTNGYNGFDPASPSGGAGVRHNAGCNYAFVDGHSKWWPASYVQGASYSIWDLN